MKIIAFTFAYNAEETIGKCIENAKEQGLDVVVIDNGCTDNTIEIAKKLGASIFEHKTEIFSVYEMIAWTIPQIRKVDCDWYVHKDTDEIFETYDGKKVIEVVNKADSLGYNCMRFDMYEFWPTVDDDLTIKDFTKRIQYYSYYNSHYLKMVKNSSEIHLSNPHKASGECRESPQRLVMRHYKFINLEQGRRKVRERFKRWGKTNFSSSAHPQYNQFTNESKYYVLEKDVYSKLYKFDGTWIKEKVFDGWRGYKK